MTRDAHGDFVRRSLYAVEGLDVPAFAMDKKGAPATTRTVGPASYAPGCYEQLPRRREIASSLNLPVHPALPSTTLGQLSLGHMSTSGEILDDLSIVLRFSYGVLRWEPYNDFKQHRAVPSPRSLFPLRICLIVSDGRAGRIFEYSPPYHALIELGNVAATPRGCELVVLAPLANLPLYGELAPTLTAIEAGALTAQLELMARLVGWKASTRPITNAFAYRQLLSIDHWSVIPMISMELEAPSLVEKLLHLDIAPREIVDRHCNPGNMEKFPRVREYVKACEAPRDYLPSTMQLSTESRLGSAHKLDSYPASDTSLIENVLNRSSGSRVHGLMGGKPPPDDGGITALLSDAIALAQLSSSSAPAPSRMMLAVSNDTALPPGAYEVFTGNRALVPIRQGRQPTSSSFEGAFNAKLDSLSGIVTIGSDLSGRYAESNSLRDAQLAAGRSIQYLALAAANRGMFARPTRSFNGMLLYEDQAPGWDPIIQVAIGYPQVPNLTFRQ